MGICFFSSMFLSLLTGFVQNAQGFEMLTDTSRTCVGGLHDDAYLTLGMGMADSLVIVISDNDVYPNCVITFHTMENSTVHLILVVEFPDRTEGPLNACQDVNSGIYITYENVTIDVCHQVNQLKLGPFEAAVYSLLVDVHNISLAINSKGLFETVKITATAARKSDECAEETEIKCDLQEETVCIAKELSCDDNINCGQPNDADEDFRSCDEKLYKHLCRAVVSGIIMITIIVFFLIHIVRNCLPSLPENFFIFNEDEDNKLILTTKLKLSPDCLLEHEKRTKSEPSSKFRAEEGSFDNSLGSGDYLSPIFMEEEYELKSRKSAKSQKEDDFQIEAQTSKTNPELMMTENDVVLEIPEGSGPEKKKSISKFSPAFRKKYIKAASMQADVEELEEEIAVVNNTEDG